MTAARSADAPLDTAALTEPTEHTEHTEHTAHTGHTEVLAGRTALVTGAASGIGAATAWRLAADGAAVIALDRDADRLAGVAAEIGATPLVVDLSDIAGIPAAIAEVADGIDILVNNAGIQHVEAIETFPTETFEAIMALMLTAPFALSKAVLPGMYRRGWGRIVHISSAHGLRASPYKVAYVAAKHGLEGLSKVIALEGAERGVTSNCVNPGYVRTPLVERQITEQAAAHHLSEQDVVTQVMLASSPVKRFMEPAEVAAAVAFLCSGSSASITGSDLVLDGGWGAR